MAEQVATHISVDPAVYGGRPCIDGHRIAVHDVAAWVKQGQTPEEIARDFQLTRGEVYAALAYYFDHQAEIDRELDEDEREIRTRASADASPPAERVREALKRRSPPAPGI